MSSSSEERSHPGGGGAKLVPQPRRQPSTIAPPPAPAKESTNKKLQVAQVNDPDSPTPLPKGQRTAERAASQAVPFYYQAPMQVPNLNVGYPTFTKPSFNIPSESSASSGYYPTVRMPSGYGTYISPHGGHHMVLASQSSSTSASVDAVATGIGGIKLKEYQQVSAVMFSVWLCFGTPITFVKVAAYVIFSFPGSEQIHSTRPGTDFQPAPEELPAGGPAVPVSEEPRSCSKGPHAGSGQSPRLRRQSGHGG